MTVRLHNFIRSSTSTRLRAALSLKGLAYDYVPYKLREDETRTPAYLEMNPSGLAPVLELAEGAAMDQSGYQRMAGRDTSHTAALACEIHPLNNLRVLTDLGDELGADEAAVKSWFTHWVKSIFDALEPRLAADAQTGRYCHADTPTIALIFDTLNALDAFQRAALPAQPDAA